jgi:ATP-dependent Zn protease
VFASEDLLTMFKALHRGRAAPATSAKVVRAAILAVHTRGVSLDPATRLEDVAASTPGMVGADLRNLVSEAALLAARRDRISVTSTMRSSAS